MKKLLLIPLILMLLSCSTRKSKISYCNENPKFKEKFFYNISTVEKYTKEHQTVMNYTINTNSFLESLKYISHYTKIPMDNVYNYQIGYANYQMFELDKKKWIKWYSINKCKNITP